MYRQTLLLTSTILATTLLTASSNIISNENNRSLDIVKSKVMVKDLSNSQIDKLNLNPMDPEEEKRIAKYLQIPHNILTFYGWREDKVLKNSYVKIYLKVKLPKNKIDIIYRDVVGNYIIGEFIHFEGIPVTKMEKKFINMSDDEIEEEKEMAEVEYKNKPDRDDRFKAAYAEVMNNKDKYSKYMFTLKGNNPTGNVVLMFSEPVCPACQNFEESGYLQKVIDNSKKVIVFANPLPMHEPENVYIRTKYMLENIKKASSNDQIIEEMKKAAKTPLSIIAKAVDATKVKEFWKDYDDFWDRGFITATPTLTTKDGKTTKGILYPIMRKEKKNKDSNITSDKN
jgi:hypothetical protein